VSEDSESPLNWEELTKRAKQLRALGYSVEIEQWENETKEQVIIIITRDKTRRRGKDLYG